MVRVLKLGTFAVGGALLVAGCSAGSGGGKTIDVASAGGAATLPVGSGSGTSYAGHNGNVGGDPSLVIPPMGTADAGSGGAPTMPPPNVSEVPPLNLDECSPVNPGGFDVAAVQ